MYESALYAEDAFVYNRQLYTMHWIVIELNWIEMS